MVLPSQLRALNHSIQHESVHGFRAGHTGVAVQDQTYILPFQQLFRNSSVYHRDIIGPVRPRRAIGFPADGVELEGYGLYRKLVEGRDEGREVGDGVPVARDEDEDGRWFRCGHWKERESLVGFTARMGDVGNSPWSRVG
jgi:hypothetical protein